MNRMLSRIGFGVAALAGWLFFQSLAMAEPVEPLTISSPDSDQTIPEMAEGASFTPSVSVSPAGVTPAYEWSYSVDGGATWTVIAGADTASFNFTIPYDAVAHPAATLTDGKFQVKATVADGAQTASRLWTVTTVTDVNHGPVISSPVADQTVAFLKEGDPFVQSVAATDADGDALIYRWSYSRDGGTTWKVLEGETAATSGFVLPYDIVVHPATVLMGGKCRIRAEVTDDAPGAQAATRFWTVTTVPDTNCSPVVSSPTADQVVAEIAEGAAVNAALAATDPDGDALSYQWLYSKDGGTSWTLIEGQGATLDFTVPYDVVPRTATSLTGGKFKVKGIVSDSTFSQARIWTYTTVAATNRAPVISTPNADQFVAQMAEGSAFDQQITATDPDGDPIAYRWFWTTDGGATWTLLTGETTETLNFTIPYGVVEHPATELAGAQLAFRVEVADATLSSTRTWTVATLTAGNRAPVISTPATNQTVASLAEAATFSASVTAADPDGDAISCQWQYSTDGGATWTSIDGATTAALSYAVPYDMVAHPNSRLSSLFKFRVSVTDGKLTSTRLWSVTTLNDVNRVPEISSPAADQTVELLAEGAPFNQTVIALDPEFDEMTYRWLYSTNGGTSWTVIAGQTTATLDFSIPYSAVLHPAATLADGKFKVKAEVIDVAPNAATATRIWTVTTVTDVNNAPQRGTLLATLTPAAPKTTDALTCTLSGTATDVDTEDVAGLKYRYDWFRNGELMVSHGPVAALTDILPADQSKKGQAWVCKVTVVDAAGQDSPSSADSYSTSIRNTPPTASPMTIEINGATGITKSFQLSGTDPDSVDGVDMLVYAVTLHPAHGQLAMTTSGLGSYTVKDWSTSFTETFAYTVSDNLETSAPATVTVVYTANPAGYLSFEPQATKIKENAGSVKLALTRSGGSIGQVSVKYATANGTAQSGIAYKPVTGTLIFKAGETLKTIIVPLINDTVVNGNRDFTMVLSNPVGGATIGKPAVVTLEDDDLGGMLQFSADTLAISESKLTAKLTVTRTGTNLASGVTVNYATADGTAKAGIDYKAVSGTLLFAAGIATKTVSVPLINDKADHGNRTFTMALTAPTGGAALGTPSAIPVTIQEDDQSGILQFGAATYVVKETAGKATLTVTRTGTNLVSGVTVNYATTDGTAKAGTDYTATSGTLSFAAGVKSKTITVPILNDALARGTRSFTMTLSAAVGGPTVALGPQKSAVVGILDDEIGGILQFATAAYTVKETAGNAVLTVTRTGTNVVGSTEVSYATVDGTAKAGTDYTATTGKLAFAAGEKSKTISIPVTNDTLANGTRVFTVKLSAPTNTATLGTIPVTTVNLQSEDIAGTIEFSATSYTVKENAGSAVLTVRRYDGAANGASVKYDTANGAAIAGVDYTATSGTLVFAAGETSKTISIPVINRIGVNNSRSFSVILSTPGGGAKLGYWLKPTVTIQDAF